MNSLQLFSESVLRHTEMIVHRTISSSSVEDAVLVARHAVQVPRCRSILDAGSGSGELVAQLLKMRQELFVWGIEIDPVPFAESMQKIHQIGESHRTCLVNADVFETDLPQVDIVVTNPPLMPGEIGFTTERKGYPEAFIDSLLGLCARAGLPVLTNWYGYRNMSDDDDPYDLLSVQDLADRHGMNFKVLEQGWRDVLPSSRIRTGVETMQSLFPLGIVEVNHHLTRLRDIQAHTAKQLRVGQLIVAFCS
jgi:predicted RNA methylase